MAVLLLYVYVLMTPSIRPTVKLDSLNNENLSFTGCGDFPFFFLKHQHFCFTRDSAYYHELSEGARSSDAFIQFIFCILLTDGGRK